MASRGDTRTHEGRRHNLERLRAIVRGSRGPREVLAIVNGGDGDLVQADLDAQVPLLFRADGRTRVFVHEERTRRGQLLGLLDALRRRREVLGDLDASGVALGIMLPGKGTRLSPLTQRLWGIKPFFPTLLRSGPDAPTFFHGAAASLWTWTLVVDALAARGFSGVAWKWGDEPQVPATVLADLAVDLSDADAVRFGAEVAVTEDLARNKEWLFADRRSGRLLRQVRRRPRADLLRAFGLDPDTKGVRALVHVGSPAFSHAFLEAAEEAFGDAPGWIDVDGYLFEALTHAPEAWDEEAGRDPGLQALLAEQPDFAARVRALVEGVRRRRGRPPVVKVVDLGEGLYWGDVGQLEKARASLLAVSRADAEGRFARMLAAIDGVPCDPFGNRLVGDARAPSDGSVRDTVLIDARVHGRASIEGSVLVRSDVGEARLGTGSVLVECTAGAVWTGREALLFRAVGETLEVPNRGVLTHIPADPGNVEDGLEPWRADLDLDVGSPEIQGRPAFDNPTSFAVKSEVMRDRRVSPLEAERRIEARWVAPLRARLDSRAGR